MVQVKYLINNVYILSDKKDYVIVLVMATEVYREAAAYLALPSYRTYSPHRPKNFSLVVEVLRLRRKMRITIPAMRPMFGPGRPRPDVRQSEVIASPSQTIIQCTLIEAALGTALGSALQGNVTAQVGHDVWSFELSRARIKALWSL